jgi:hypothetical protein
VRDVNVARFVSPVRETLSGVPASCYQVVADRFGDEMEQTDDYDIDWEFEVVPLNLLSCSLRVFLSLTSTQHPAWGMFFDSRARIASRFGLRSLEPPSLIGFGHEPIHISTSLVCDRIAAVVAGKVLLRYRAAFGVLWATSGAIEEAGEMRRPLGAPRLLGATVFKYEPWNHDVRR